MTERTSILLIGQPDVGKTHYGAQVYLRLDAESGSMSLVEAGDLAPFQNTIDKLSSGLSGYRTPTHEKSNSQWVIRRKRDNYEFVLDWPDYAGETLVNLVTERRIQEDWKNRIQSADGWALMIRASRVQKAYDIFSRNPLLAENSRETDVGDVQQSLSLEAQLIETLQMFAYRHQLQNPETPLPSLCLMLSCYDELTDNPKPKNFFSQHLPLLASFITSQWSADRWRVFGLSPLGQPLDPKAADADFVKQGPERMGYVIDEAGDQSEDILLPVDWLITQVKH